MTLGLALIVRDEEATLPGLLASIEGAFDQVALLDTGSTDRTREVFVKWAEQQRLDYLLDTYPWHDDFAAARNAADALLTTEWCCWADADDTIRGAGNLRRIAAAAPPEVAGLSFAYATHGGAFPVTRLTRRGARTWEGRVHETPTVTGPCPTVPPALVHWVHHSIAGAKPRDLRIARSWARDEPTNPRAVQTAAQAEIDQGDIARGIELYRAYLALPAVRQRLDARQHAHAAYALDELQSWAADWPGPADTAAHSWSDEECARATGLMQRIAAYPPASWLTAQ